MEFTVILIIITTIIMGLFYRILQYFLNILHIYNTVEGRLPGPKAYPIIGNAHLFIGDTESKFLTYIFYI